VLFRHNTSNCWHIAVDKDDPDSLLCISEDVHVSKTDYWQCRLSKINLKTGEEMTVGRFPPNLIATYAATYDSAKGIFYAFLAQPPPTHSGTQPPDSVLGMDSRTGTIVTNASHPFELMLKTFDWDAKSGKVLAIVETYEDTGGGQTWREHFGSLHVDMGGEALQFEPRGAADAYKARGYTQINTGAMAADRGMYFASMFKKDRLFLVGTNAESGAVEYEYERQKTGLNQNFVGVAYFDAAPQPFTAAQHERRRS
jgi:hypothetical protein